ncbi:MAG: DUF4129 domain-containing protein [Armatimonadetes bacterium]|nr:DUF4129 domain-containing protein [Armatimonadota bacterium]
MRCLGLAFFWLLTVNFAALAQPKTPAPVVSAATYRATLQKALRELEAMEKRPPRRLGPLLKQLDTAFTVRRADGQTQTVNGNAWSKMARDLAKPAAAMRRDVIRARQMAQSQIGALDEWTKRPYYAPADAQKIMAGLESSGQIRTGPFWWQTAIADAWKTVANAWDNFQKWLNSLFPTPATPNIAAPSDKWLWFLFYALVVAILAAVAWFVWRAFGGKWSRRAVRREAVLQGEDAALLLLPPDELRARADDFAAAGNFREALRHRYLSLLLQLDARGVWRYDARRTNWEHLAALGRSETKRALVPALSDLTRRFDRVRYGGAGCGGEDWSRFEADAREFEARAASFETLTEAVR